jgi:putative glutamine amidotransferase
MNSPRRPVIGITMDTRDGEPGYYQLGFDYAKSVEKAGGLPLAIPYKTDPALIPQFADLLDGLLFTGGNDLDPSLYGETWHPKAARIDPDRQSFELALLAEVERRRMPTLAICLGCQLLNVYRGGSLHQFLPEVDGKGEHRRTTPGQPSRRHAVTIEPDSAIGRAIGKPEVSTNTYHKQAVKTVGKGLRVTAVADDGTIEALEDPSYPLLAAVQWHPERLNGEQEHLAPFRLLVDKAAQNRR